MISIVISIVTLPPRAAIVINVNSLILRLCLIARSLSDTVKTNAKILIIMRKKNNKYIIKRMIK